MNDQIVIEKYAAADHKVRRFRMSDEDSALQIFLRRYAKPSAAAQLTQTYVATEADSPDVLGYVTVMCAEIGLQKSYNIADKIDADRYEFQPALRVARLAVCSTHARKGLRIGQRLLDTAVGIAITSIAPSAGCRFVILDAKKKSVDFYTKSGFRRLDTDENRRNENPVMFLDLKNLALE